MSWNILVTRNVEKQSKKLPKDVQEILTALIFDLEAEGPRPKGWQSKPLKKRDEWSIRLKRKWRALIVVQKREVTIKIVKVAHRKEVYQ